MRMTNRVWISGCLLGALLLLAFFVITGYLGVPELRRLVKPTETGISLNPMFNIWPGALICAILLAVVTALNARAATTPGAEGMTDPWARRRRKRVVTAVLQGFLGGLVLGAGLLGWGAAALALANARLDSSPPAPVTVPVEQIWFQQEKLGDQYYAQVADWRSPDGEPVLVYLGQNADGKTLSDALTPPADALITTQRGFAGITYVTAVEAAP